ncbi:unnamed protein product [Mytilus coruscus]|uniref:Uncharacterized protein n=1 Tax=Mytilus coruscus TaxID=42192 RepID=A0A6J8BUA3_MYTCO|nr:unnamed protein product [Mytilus coruscus]
METDDVKPGYAKLKLIHNNHYDLLNLCEEIKGSHYLSSALPKQRSLLNCPRGSGEIHGPCISDKLGLTEIAKRVNCMLAKTASFSQNIFFRGIQQTVRCRQSSIKNLYAYHMSVWCSSRAQYFPLNSISSNNKYQYKEYKSCFITLVHNIYHDAVSGWLMLAFLFYKTKQYRKALHIIMYSVSKCTSEKLYRFVDMSDIHYQLLNLKSFQNKSIVELLKISLVHYMHFEVNSLLLPDELRQAVGKLLLCTCSIPCTAYACYLSFLCHYHLKNVRECYNSLQALELVIAESYLIKTSHTTALAYYLLSMSLQLAGDTEYAQQAFLQSVQIFNEPFRKDFR